MAKSRRPRDGNYVTRTEHWEVESRKAGDVEMSEDADGSCRFVFNRPGNYVIRHDALYGATSVNWPLPQCPAATTVATSSATK